MDNKDRLRSLFYDRLARWVNQISEFRDPAAVQGARSKKLIFKVCLQYIVQVWKTEVIFNPFRDTLVVDENHSLHLMVSG